VKLSEKLEQYIEKNAHSRHNVIKLLDIPDYANIKRAREVGRAIEDDQTVDRLMSVQDSVVIGTEIASEDLQGSSVIKFDYKVGGESVASVGILGPERMDYKKLIVALYSLMSATVENRKLNGGQGPPKQIETDKKDKREEGG
jgi:transcriptional regulator of heat shock response